MQINIVLDKSGNGNAKWKKSHLIIGGMPGCHSLIDCDKSGKDE